MFSRQNSNIVTSASFVCRKNPFLKNIPIKIVRLQIISENNIPEITYLLRTLPMLKLFGGKVYPKLKQAREYMNRNCMNGPKMIVIQNINSI